MCGGGFTETIFRRRELGGVKYIRNKDNAGMVGRRFEDEVTLDSQSPSHFPNPRDQPWNGVLMGVQSKEHDVGLNPLSCIGIVPNTSFLILVSILEHYNL